MSEFLAMCSHFWADVDAVRFTCPRCNGRSEARLEVGRIWLGYVYSAGMPHFCGMEEVRIEGLRAWRDGTDLVAELDGASFRIRR